MASETFHEAGLLLDVISSDDQWKGADRALPGRFYSRPRHFVFRESLFIPLSFSRTRLL